MEGQKSQPMGAKATEGKPEGKPAIGPKRGAAVRPHSQPTAACWAHRHLIDCMLAVLAPVVEAAGLPHVFSMAPGYGWPPLQQQRSICASQMAVPDLRTGS